MKSTKFKLFLLALSLFILTAFTYQGIQRISTLYVQTLRVTTSAEFQGTNTFTGAATADDLTVTHLVGRSTFVNYKDVAAAPSIYAAADVVSATASITTSILGIDTPRNAVIVWTTITTSTAGNITVTGVNARGAAATELVAVAAVSGTQTLLGVVPWVSISSFALPTRTEAVTMTVTGGQKFGLPYLPEVAGDVYHVTVNLTPQAAPTVNTANGTFDPVSTPAAAVDYNVWVKQ